MCGSTSLRIFLMILPLLLFFSGPVHAASVLDGFNPNADNTVYSLAVQADGKILVGGAFNHINGQAKSHIARLNTDGSVDTTFTADTNGSVYSIVVQANGKILVGGDFTMIGGQSRSYVARLDTNGSVETAFNPNANGMVRAIAVQLNGDIIVGGNFTTISSQARSYIARLSASNGSLDSNYKPDANAPVYSLATQINGKVIAGGLFTIIGGQSRNNIARLNAIDGSAETTEFDIQADGAVRSIFIQNDGKILIGGDFTTLTDRNGSNTRQRIALLDADGAADFNFDPNANGVVRSIVVQTDGNILVGGDFTTIGGQSRSYMARLNIQFGAADTSFTPNANNVVHSIAVQTDGKILAGGAFTTITDSIASHPRNRIARMHTDGTVEADFNPNANNAVSAIAVQADGNILVGGTFTQIGVTSRNRIARIHPNGVVDTTFSPAVNNGEVTSIVIQIDGKILIGGTFTSITDSIATYSRNFIARLNADGTVDTAFNPVVNGNIYAIAVQADGNILIGGDFTIVTITDSYGTATDYPRSRIARLYPDGTLESFSASANAAVRSIAVQADGKILVGGDFISIVDYISLKNRNRIARIDAYGTVDTTFDANANGVVRSIVGQADGNILVGGDFSYIGNQTRNRIARLYTDSAKADAFNPNANNSVRSIAVQTDGKILVVGNFTTIGGQSRNKIARLTALTGAADSSFNPVVAPASAVSSITVQTDGKVIIGGNFTTIDGQPRNRMARLSADSAALQEFTVSIDGNTINWNRSQSSPEVYDVIFAESADNEHWTPLIGAGPVTRITGGWQLVMPNPNPLFIRQNRYIKALGKTYGGFSNGSTSSIQSVSQYFIDYHTLTIDPVSANGKVTSNLVGIDCGIYCSHAYQANTSLTLTAAANYGYIFTNWSGDCGTDGNETDNPVDVLMDIHRTCSANFAMTYTLDLQKSGTGSGTVGAAGAINKGLPGVYIEGTNAQATAVADSGSIFTGWSGDCSGTTSPFELLPEWQAIKALPDI